MLTKKSVVWIFVAASLALSASITCAVAYTSARSFAEGQEAKILSLKTRLVEKKAGLCTALASTMGVTAIPDHAMERALSRLGRRGSAGRGYGLVDGLLRDMDLEAEEMTDAQASALASKVEQLLTQGIQDLRQTAADSSKIDQSYRTALASSWQGYWLRRAGFPKISLAAVPTRPVRAP